MIYLVIFSTPLPQSPGITSCLPLTLSQNLLLNTTNVSIGTVVRFGCVDGLLLQGNSITVCQSNGTWNSTVPTCVSAPVQCPEIPTLEHMSTSTTNRSVGAEVTLTCDKGYEMDGQGTIYCMKNGTWSAPFPKCMSTV